MFVICQKRGILGTWLNVVSGANVGSGGSRSCSNSEYVVFDDSSSCLFDVVDNLDFSSSMEW